MSAPLIQEDPPPSKTQRRGQASRHATGPQPGPVACWLWSLRDFPGVWHRYPYRVSNTMPTRVNRGEYVGVEPGEFDAVGRHTHTARRTCVMYARYIGGES